LRFDADGSLLRRDLKVVSGFDFDRLIPCHGEVIETGAKAIFDNNFEWYLEEQHED
jgi:hypothetical protein